GKPVSEAFYFATGYNERHELLRDGVLLAHMPTPGAPACGEIEPVVWRETTASHQFGASLSRGRVCWVPGSRLAQEAWLTLAESGLWE
ncbi:MAG: hypothetical protein M1482_10780, partial [Chloroflexi bacterium]|nr:hypothetical protein [Chloroflexota bacterium]